MPRLCLPPGKRAVSVSRAIQVRHEASTLENPVRDRGDTLNSQIPGSRDQHSLQNLAGGSESCPVCQIQPFRREK